MKYEYDWILEQVVAPLIAGAICGAVMACLLEPSAGTVKSALNLLLPVLVAGGTLILAFWTAKSVGISRLSVDAALQSIKNDVQRSKRQATLDLFYRYEEVLIGSRIRMSAHAAASKIIAWKDHLDLMSRHKSQGQLVAERPELRTPGSQIDRDAREYEEFYSAFPIITNFWKASLALLKADVLDQDLFMRLFARICIRSYNAIIKGN